MLQLWYNGTVRFEADGTETNVIHTSQMLACSLSAKAFKIEQWRASY